MFGFVRRLVDIFQDLQNSPRFLQRAPSCLFSVLLLCPFRFHDISEGCVRAVFWFSVLFGCAAFASGAVFFATRHVFLLRFHELQFGFLFVFVFQV